MSWVPFVFDGDLIEELLLDDHLVVKMIHPDPSAVVDHHRFNQIGIGNHEFFFVEPLYLAQ